MRGSVTIVTLAILFIGIVACERDATQPGYEIPFMADMKRPIPYEAYSENQVLKDGMTLQHPVEGTVSRGSLIQIPAKNPLPATEEVVDRGKHIYQTYCLICHGVSGEGDGPLIPKYPNPPGLKSRRMMDLSTRETFRSITYGKKDMPAHGGQIEESDRWALIHYFRVLQGKSAGVEK